MTFNSPLAVEVEPDAPDALHPDRIYVLEKQGRIRTLVPGDDAAILFLDLDVNSAGEGGLLGLAFHPDYATNGRLFVSYTASVDAPEFGVRVMESRLSEFARSATDPLAVDPASERVLLRVDQPYENHNGGTIDFGPDGMLYYGLGDGGLAGDPLENGQDPTTLLGAILRIDVDDVPEGEPYGIPEDNPFAATDGPERDEIYAYGFRNPFKFDVGEDGLWVGDVGQNTWEEIDVVESGGNYGWNQVEGPECYRPGCDLDAYEAPVTYYGHDVGQSVTGGFVLPDDGLPYGGSYLFGDFVTGRLWAFDPDTEEQTVVFDQVPGCTVRCISSIDLAPNGVDALITDYQQGKVYRLSRFPVAVEPGPDGAALSLAGPNPFRQSTAVRLDAPGTARVALVDALGREVAVLWDGPAAGREIRVDGADLAPGVYSVVAMGEGRRSALRVVRTE